MAHFTFLNRLNRLPLWKSQDAVALLAISTSFYRASSGQQKLKFLTPANAWCKRLCKAL